MHNLGAVLSFRGDYGQGLTAALAYDEAHRHLESGLETAKDVGPTVMITYASGFLASLYIQQQRFDEAARLLPELPVEPMMGQDHWLVRPAAALVLLKQGATQALHLLDQQTLPEQSNWLGWLAYFYGAIPLLRGKLLTELGWFDEAETALNCLLALYQEQGVRMDLWRVHLALGQVHQATGNLERAKTAFVTARTIVEELAATVTDNALRKKFQWRALDLISTESSA